MEHHENSKEKSGITTGSVATAASVAALLTITDKTPEVVTIDAPNSELIVEIKESKSINSTKASATVIKPTYNDPDVTRGIEIISEVTLTDNIDMVEITAGEGVGKVTKPGLQIPVGEYAINPVPRKMIEKNVKKFLPENKGAIVKIIIPEGKKLAPKTMNSRLGILDGISVLGTTGIARPMSSKAYTDSLRVQIDVAIANGYYDLLFVPGNIGTRIAKEKLEIKDDEIIEMSNFVGFMLEEADKTEKVNSITLFGHAGKLIKIAAGIFNTKQSVADARREIMTAYAGLVGADTETMKSIYECITTEDVIKILNKQGLTTAVFELIADKIVELCELKFNIKFNAVIVQMDGTVLNPSKIEDIPFKWK
ncbi:cobalt-precorrin-5B (C(1))-methyltransferase CbiD [Methanosphaera sp. ISO3-F5]|uniref:cobalt-precorrin-5B (C(1))-methyltransferase CbiD n=1 Tax=Methanosphaera sp. ISO3-F5 TaxID=1452353 RepID=UPI002B2621FF|nr:cobalt-precorrin-5B (C(1))-methyltransferase CbiD [Methanosphaera sp. ISO3-F5]WQH65262.1 cobalt-precorrin-5B (C(1))-methyltransferase CbiD [Methanosphaera sp. ISO3-F5]